jgi:hypothetical protein
MSREVEENPTNSDDVATPEGLEFKGLCEDVVYQPGRAQHLV